MPLANIRHWNLHRGSHRQRFCERVKVVLEVVVRFLPWASLEFYNCHIVVWSGLVEGFSSGQLPFYQQTPPCFNDFDCSSESSEYFLFSHCFVNSTIRIGIHHMPWFHINNLCLLPSILGSFEVVVDDKLIYSKLQTMALPDYEEVAHVVQEVSNGAEPREIKGQQPVNCAIS